MNKHLCKYKILLNKISENFTKEEDKVGLYFAVVGFTQIKLKISFKSA